MKKEVSDDVRMQVACNQLAARLEQFRNKALNKELIDDIQRVVKQHRAESKLRDGLDFPELTPMIVPRLGTLHLVRRDLRVRDVAVVLQNITAMYPTVTSAELAQAVRWAFPAYVKALLEPVALGQLSTLLRVN